MCINQIINYHISVPWTTIQPLKTMYLNRKLSKKLLSEKTSELPSEKKKKQVKRNQYYKFGRLNKLLIIADSAESL